MTATLVTLWDCLKERLELVIPVLGVLILRAMLTWEDMRLTDWQTVLVYGSAVLYASLVLWSPQKLPVKEPQKITQPFLKQTAVKVGSLVLIGFAVLTLLSLTGNAGSDERLLGLGGAITAVLLLTMLGTVGLAAERILPLDLFPLLRQLEKRRIVYVLVAALFLALIVQLWGGIWSDLSADIGQAVGEIPPSESETASLFAGNNPLHLFLNFLIGAGLFEELLFRVGILTPIWALTKHWGWGLLVSAIAFGLYHISPLSSLATINLQAPVTAVLESFGVGLAMGVIYRNRGFMTAVMTHALGNWLVVMILSGT